MNPTAAELILNPIRMQIIQAMMGRRMTARQLGEALPDVAQATLYRHLRKLSSAGLLIVVEERPVRGTVEKVYSVLDNAASLTSADVAHASKEDHMRYFGVFVASLLGEFRRYLERETIDFEADGVGYRFVALNLSDEEFQRLVAARNATLLPALANQPGPGRRRHLFASIVMPAADTAMPSPDPPHALGEDSAR